MDKEILRQIEADMQLGVTNIEKVTGGDINETYVVHSSGTRLFIKLNDDERPDMFEKESRGLELLRTANAICVPQPLAHGRYNKHIYLVMEYIAKQPSPADFWRVFGQQLSSLHTHTSDTFGLDHDNYIGSLPQRNNACSSWAEFYAVHRLLFLIRVAYDQRKCDSSDTRMMERLCNKLEALFPPEKPALLHGDLWSGNSLCGTKGQPVIYDPAVYYGHREMDIGMSLLFGGFDQSFYSHYNESWPMEKNWRNRTDLTQLYPLLVHLVLFGGHYYQSVKDVLRKYS